MNDFNYEIEKANHYFFENFTVDGKAVQDGTPTPSNPVDVQVVQGVNLFNITATTQTVSGVTFTVNADGTVTANGTATATIAFAIGTVSLPAGSYMVSGCPATGTSSTYRLSLAYHGYEYGSGLAITGPVLNRLFSIAVFSGYTCNNLVFKPQIEAGSTATPYIPYGSIGLKVNDTITPINLNGNVLASLPDGTRDTVTVDGAGHVTIEKNVGERTFDGSENWSLSGGAKRVNNNDLRALTRKSSNNYTVMPILCNRFTPQTALQTYNGTVGVSIDTEGDIGFATGETLTVDGWKTWLETNPVTIYYPLATSQTIDLGYIDVSNLKDISEEIPISIISTLDPETRYSYINHPSYDVLNPYEDYNAPEYAYPPNHFGQEWETFDANDWNVSEMFDYTGQMESHAVYTVELCELMQSGAFDWKRPEIDWSEAAYDAEQYDRFCKYFESRFMFREISMLPPLQWFTALKRMMVYELMPKYRPLYAQVENGISPLGENEYYKERHVSSAYPETLLSGNSDYISSGEDKEFERIKVDNAAEALEAYRNGFRSVDAAIGDELEVLFISMYTSFANAL